MSIKLIVYSAHQVHAIVLLLVQCHNAQGIYRLKNKKEEDGEVGFSVRLLRSCLLRGLSVAIRSSCDDRPGRASRAKLTEVLTNGASTSTSWYG
jgi:hypothetical protein